MEERDAIVVGARCAGGTLATALARRGLDVLLVDRDEFPSETLSTHLLYPNTLARLRQLGILDTLEAAHEVPLLGFRMSALGHGFGGRFTPIDGFDGCAAPRRVALDKAIVDTAISAGAAWRFDERVVDLIGSGTAGDPVAGVVLESGEELRARWVFGADGRASTVASRLGLEKTGEMRGEVAYLLGYWRGVPNDGWASTEVHRDEMLGRWAGEDGTTLMTLWGDAGLTRGSREERRRRYLDGLGRFPELVSAAELEGAELIGDVVAAPESIMRGYFRAAAGPGWALVGDSCHFKHPATAQGIADAIEQAVFIAGALADGDGGLDGYGQWRDRRAREHYPWSYTWARFPTAAAELVFRGLAGDAEATQDLLDSYSRRVEPSQVFTQERIGRWSAGAADASASTPV
jgi:2-polyprenyl-6-methoxyphenol hydroxylase-like FAD-dependent oxidoreductase